MNHPLHNNLSLQPGRKLLLMVFVRNLFSRIMPFLLSLLLRSLPVKNFCSKLRQWRCQNTDGLYLSSSIPDDRYKSFIGNWLPSIWFCLHLSFSHVLYLHSFYFHLPSEVAVLSCSDLRNIYILKTSQNFLDKVLE